MNDAEYQKAFDKLENVNSHFACGVLMAARYGTQSEFIEMFEAAISHGRNLDRKTSNNACETRDKIMKAIRIRENAYPNFPNELQ